MRNKLGFDSTAFWISFLLVLLVVLNVIAFIVYKAASPLGIQDVEQSGSMSLLFEPDDSEER